MTNGRVLSRARGATRRGVIAGAVCLPFVSRAAAPGTIRLGHALPSSHPVHRAMVRFAELVEEGTRGEVRVQIYADGMVGQEPQLLEQVRAGTLDMTKASTSALEASSPRYRIFDLPFLFRDRAHWLAAVNGPVGEEVLRPAGASDLVGLTYYDAGARSFYARRSILHPEDLKGLVIRVQFSRVAARMVELLGAEPKMLPWAVVFSALQTGLVDGAENNLTALIHGRHGEVVKFYSFTEHGFVPDVLLVNPSAWAKLSPAQQEVFRRAARDSAALQQSLWTEAEAASVAASEKLGVTFQRPDKRPFMERVAPLRAELAADQDLARLIARIEALA